MPGEVFLRHSVSVHNKLNHSYLGQVYRVLKYLVESTEQLAALAIMAGMLLAYIRIAYQGRAAFIM